MSSSSPKLSLEQINKMSRDQFVGALGPIFEGPPWIADAAWSRRPFRETEDLYSALCDVMYNAPVEQQEVLIRSHPDLVGRAALTGTLSRESTQEQASAGLDALSQGEIERFNTLNSEYKERFGFPFVICARENKKESILEGFASRMGNSREDEIATALDEISKIARLRLQDMVSEPV